MKISDPEKSGPNQNLKFNNRFGKYLISHLNTWHGGVHIEGLNTPIQAIANGRIIAYRFTEEYKELLKTKDKVTTAASESSETETEYFKYVNSFVLIQHDIPLTKTVTEKVVICSLFSLIRGI
ncbi:hypothetical protein [Aquimarina longa]|uniref:hypothetical protein n=1 Tax=Aquimarina longa TaxID=1080221 RepID=UPI00078187BC|nr:hypothetical protein [Aquimarina longa]